MKTVAVLTIVIFILAIAVVCLTMRVINVSRELSVADTQVADVRVVADEPVVLSGVQTIDGVVVADGDRAGVRAQRNVAENGVWIVNGSGDWTRAAAGALKSGSMFRCLDGRRNGGRMFTVFGRPMNLIIVNLGEAVLGRRHNEEDGQVLVTAQEWPRGVRFVPRDTLQVAELEAASELTSVPPRGLAIFELPPSSLSELHVRHNRALVGKARLVGGKIVRQTGELLLDVTVDGDSEVTVRNTAGVDNVSAQVFSVCVR